MSIKMLHTSDLHIDWLFSKFAPQAKAERRKELMQILDVLGDLALAQEVDVVLICGDLFHSNKVDKHVIAKVWLSLSRITEKGIYVLIIPGNHDEDIKVLFESMGEDNARLIVLGEKETFTEIDNLTIYGVPFKHSESNQSPLRKVQKVERPGFHVIMVHGSVKTLPFIEDKYGPISPEEIAQSGLDYIALGHYHNFNNCSSGAVKAYYPGSPNTLSFECTGERYALIVEFGEEVRVTPYSMPSRPYLIYEYKMTNRGLTDLYRQIELWANKEACVKLILKGLVDSEIFPLKDRVFEHCKDMFFYFEVVDDTMLIPTEDFNDQTIKGIFVRKIYEGLNTPNLSDKERAVLIEALRVGLMAIEGRRLT